MRAILILLLLLSIHSASAAPAELPHGAIVSGNVVIVAGELIQDGETNATQPWVVDQIAGASGVVAQATAARFARITQPVLEHSLNMTGTWYDAGGGISTNAEGWSMSGVILTNGTALYPTNDLSMWIQSPPTTNGAAMIHVDIAAALNTYVWLVEATNDVLQGELVADGFLQNEGSLDVLLAIADPVALKLQFDKFVLPDAVSNYTAISSFEVYGWSAPEYIGATNNYQGMTLLVSEASDHRSPPTWGQVTAAIHAVRISMTSADWSGHAAISPVNLSGQPLRWDAEYSSYTETGALVIAWQNNPIIRMIAGAYLPVATSEIVSASISDSNITLGVLASTGWRPFPEWSTNTITWTRLTTNQFVSTYPLQSNGLYQLTFAAVATDAWYRVWSTNEAGGSVTGSVDILSENLTHRGVRVATVADLPDAFGSAVTTTNPVTFSNASVIIIGSDSNATLRLGAIGETNAPSRPIRFFARDGSGVDVEGRFQFAADGRLSIVVGGVAHEVFSAQHNSFLSIPAFQAWNTNAIKHYIGAPATATSAPPVGVTHAIRSAGTNVYPWLPDLGRWGHIGVSTNGGGL